MITRTGSRSLLMTLPLLLVCLVIAVLATGVRGDDDEHEEEGRSAAATTYPDSLLQRLNESYQTVKPIMVTSCYDCHSNKTRFPWYHSLPGVKRFLDDHIREAIEHLDMSNDFPFGGEHGLKSSLNDVKAEIYEGEMPIFSYLIMHWGTEVTGSRRDSLFAWIDSSLAALEAYDRASIMVQPASSDGQ